MGIGVSTGKVIIGLSPFTHDRSPLLLTDFDGAVGVEWTAGGSGSITPAKSVVAGVA